MNKGRNQHRYKKEVIKLLQWSKQAEWIDGATKRAFIDNDWRKYIELFEDNDSKKSLNLNL